MSASATSATILIVDDELLNRKLIQTLLAPEGYRTVTAVGGEEALAEVARSIPDLILLDAMMPVIDGYEVARRIKSDPATAHVPIIMVTAFDDRGSRIVGLEAGVEDFLAKPVDRAELWLRVRNLLRLKTYADVIREHSSNLERQVRERTVELQRFRTAMDATSDIVTLVNRTTMRYIEVNAAGVAISGFSREEILAMGPEHVLDSTAESLASEYDAVIACEERQPCQGWVMRRDGTRVPVEINRQAMRSDDDWIIVSVSRDVTERREAETRLEQLAYYDTLTGLPNRRLFQESLQQSLEQADALGMHVVLMFLDVDNFKNVNDSLGHAVGDELLRQVGKRLIDCLYVRDSVGRLGGDEFAVSLLVAREASVALIVARKIHQAFEAAFEIEGHVVHATVSIGITIYPLDTTTSASMMRFADLAMYSAKQAGRDTSRFYTAAMNQRVRDRLELEAALRGALARSEFLLHYQPKVCLRTGEWTGVEALLRWHRPGHGLVSPGDFVPALEATGLVVPVGNWVLDTACRQIKAWRDGGLGDLPVAVNVSALQLAHRALASASEEVAAGDAASDGDTRAPAPAEPSGLHATAMASLQRNDIGPDLLELEITESTVMTDAAHNVDVLRQLRALGIRLSVDDFGTGYSSLAYLRRLPLDALKIDGSFIRDLTADGDDAAITLAIIEMAHRLNLQVVAECVETDAQLQHLRAVGCDEAQGYFLARPMPVDALEALWRATGGRVALDGACSSAAGTG